MLVAIEIWNSLPDPVRFGLGENWVFVYKILRVLAYFAGLDLYEDFSIG